MLQFQTVLILKSLPNSFMQLLNKTDNYRAEYARNVMKVYNIKAGRFAWSVSRRVGRHYDK